MPDIRQTDRRFVKIKIYVREINPHLSYQRNQIIQMTSRNILITMG